MKDASMINTDPVERAEKCLSFYGELVGHDESNIRDLLTDMMHMCGQLGPDFDNELRIARDNYDAEVEDALP